MAKAQFHSNEISCGGCTSSIEKGLSAVEGVSSVSGDPDAKTVDVEYDDSKVTTDAILAKLDEIGFESTLVSA